MQLSVGEVTAAWMNSLKLDADDDEDVGRTSKELSSPEPEWHGDAEYCGDSGSESSCVEGVFAGSVEADPYKDASVQSSRDRQSSRDGNSRTGLAFLSRSSVDDLGFDASVDRHAQIMLRMMAGEVEKSSTLVGRDSGASTCVLTTSVAVLAEIPLRSPQKLFIFYYQKNIFVGSKYPKIK